MSRQHGRNGMLYISTSGAGAASAAVSMTEWTLEAGRDRVDVTAFQDENKSYLTGPCDMGGSMAGWWDDTVDTLWDAANSQAPVRLYLYPTSMHVGVVWYGYAWVDFQISVGVQDAVKLSGKWSAAGDWVDNYYCPLEDGLIFCRDTNSGYIYLI